jgi:hypothetical protein
MFSEILSTFFKVVIVKSSSGRLFLTKQDDSSSAKAILRLVLMRSRSNSHSVRAAQSDECPSISSAGTWVSQILHTSCSDKEPVDRGDAALEILVAGASWVLLLVVSTGCDIAGLASTLVGLFNVLKDLISLDKEDVLPLAVPEVMVPNDNGS